MTTNYNILYYDALTSEEIEAQIEQVDWFMIPLHLITEELKTKFGSMPKLKARLWFEDILSKMIIKEDQELYPKQFFFFIDDKFYMQFSSSNGRLWCYYDYFWIVFRKKYFLNDGEIRNLIETVMKQHFKNMFKVNIIMVQTNNISLEELFKNKEAITINSLIK